MLGLARARPNLRPGHIPLCHIPRNCIRIPLCRIAIAATTRALQEKPLAGVHLDTRGGRCLVFLTCADAHHKAGAAALASTGDALRGKPRLVEAADHGRVLEELVFALHRESTSPAAGAA